MAPLSCVMETRWLARPATPGAPGSTVKVWVAPDLSEGRMNQAWPAWTWTGMTVPSGEGGWRGAVTAAGRSKETMASVRSVGPAETVSCLGGEANALRERQARSVGRVRFMRWM